MYMYFLPEIKFLRIIHSILFSGYVNLHRYPTFSSAAGSATVAIFKSYVSHCVIVRPFVLRTPYSGSGDFYTIQ